MVFTTELLIKKMKDLVKQYPKGFYLPGSDNEIYNCMEADLSGRLFIIEEEMRFFDDSWIQNGQDRIASENWQIVQDRLQWLKEERKRIRFALKQEGVTE